ncbi:beta strand repeat-containing protein [Candidatus Margulisiibacteriota bacterium]
MLKVKSSVAMFLVGVMVCWSAGAAWAAVPAKMSYEGRLLDSGGDPVTTPTSVVFKIYDVASGGSALWTSDPTSVTPDSNGVFTTLMTNESSPLAATDFSATPRYLEVVVEDEPIVPRAEFASAAYAFRAAVADSYTGNTITGTLTIESGNLHVTSGRIGVGTTGPASELHLYSAAPVLTATSTNNDSGLRINVTGLDADGDTLFRIQDNNTTRATIDKNGYVGLGTTAPTNALHVSRSLASQTNPGEGGGLVYVKNTSTASGAHASLALRTASSAAGDPFLSFDISGEYGWSAGVDNSDGNKFKIDRGWVNVGDNTDLVIDTSGNVGIGDSTPSYKLDVNGTAGFGGIIYSNAGAGVTGIDMNNNNIIEINTMSINDTGANEGLRYNGAAASWVIDVSALSRGNEDGNLNLYGTANNIALWRPTLFVYNASNYTTATPRSDGGLNFTTTGSGDITFKPGGFVGIGTSEPTHTLHVYEKVGSSTIVADAASGNNPNIMFQVDGQAAANIRINDTGADQLQFSIYDSLGGTANYVMSIDTAGNVGIGTDSPGQKLTVAGTIESTLGGIKFPNGSIQTVASGASNWAVSSDDIYNTNAGNVGIGTAEPGAKLDVAYGGVSLLLGADLNATTRTDSTVKYARIGVPHYTNAEEPMIFALLESTSANNNVFIGGGTSAGNAANNIFFNTASDQTTLIGTRRMAINSSGNVGIGTDSPGQKLTVIGTIESTTGGIKFPNGTIQTTAGGAGGEWTASGDDIYNSNSGNVGIGTTSPGWDLHVYRTGEQAEIMIQGDVAQQQSLVFRDTATRWTIYKPTSSTNLQFWDGSNVVMALENGGNVGIGTTSPGQKLTVAGTIESTTGGIKFPDGTIQTTSATGAGSSQWTTTGSDIYYNTGKVGIGTTGPNTLLDLAGVHRQAAKITSYSSTYTDYRGHPTLLFRKSHSDTLGTNATTLNGEEVGALEFEAIGSDTNPGAIAKIDVQQAGTAGSGGSWRTPGKMLFYLTDASNLGSVVTPLYLTSDNRVGIGTTPSTNLHVSGNAILADNTTIDPDSYSNSVVAGSIADGGGWVATGIGGNSGAAGRSWGIAGSGGNVYFGCQNGSSVNTMQTYMMFDANRDTILNPTSGNVGIGTASPYGKLSLYSGTSNDYLVIDAPAAYQSAVAWYSAGAQKWALYRPADSSDLLLYEGAGGGANRVAFKAGGNVGIGTTSPSGNLHVSNPAATSASIEARIQGSSQATCLEVGEDGTDNKMMRLHYWGSSYSQTNNNYPNMALIAVGNDASNGLTLRTGHADAPIKFDTNGSTNERMRITGAGDVGIGTTEPSVKLHVVGDSTSHLARFLNTNTETPGSSGLHVSTSGTGSGGRSIVDLYSNNFGDREFYFNDIGNAKCDGSWLTGGADFAEWFEKEEAVPEGALVGLNLDTGKVRVWRKGDPYVGVQSVNPGFIGNGIGGADSQDDELRKTHVLVALIGQVLIKHGEIIEQDRKVTTADGQFVGWKLADGRVFIK